MKKLISFIVLAGLLLWSAPALAAPRGVKGANTDRAKQIREAEKKKTKKEKTKKKNTAAAVKPGAAGKGKSLTKGGALNPAKKTAPAKKKTTKSESQQLEDFIAKEITPQVDGYREVKGQIQTTGESSPAASAPEESAEE